MFNKLDYPNNEILLIQEKQTTPHSEINETPQELIKHSVTDFGQFTSGNLVIDSGTVWQAR